MKSHLVSKRDELRALAKELGTIQKSRRAREDWGGLLIKALCVVVASAIAAMAQFLTLQPGESLTSWGYIGVFSAVLILIGGAYSIITDRGAGTEIETARRAVSIAQEYDDWSRHFDYLARQLDRATELYQAMTQMAQAIGIFNMLGLSDEDEVVNLLFELGDPVLILAFDFEATEHWTFSVYRADDDPDCCTILSPISSRRSDRAFDARKARSWPVGVGFAGISFARGGELIIGDISNKALGNFDNLPEYLAKEDDQTKYRSIASVPIFVGGEKWGVVVATSNTPGRFDSLEDPGVRRAEAVRALAEMIALALATRHKPSSGGKAKPKPARAPRPRKPRPSRAAASGTT